MTATVTELLSVRIMIIVHFNCNWSTFTLKSGEKRLTFSNKVHILLHQYETN